MCPAGLALHHPAADLLKEWAMYGCPTQTGKKWKREDMQAAIERGPHRSALSDEAIAHFKAEVDKKVRTGQAKLVAWDSIKRDPPQVKTISFYLGPDLSLAPGVRGGNPVGQLDDGEDGT